MELTTPFYLYKKVTMKIKILRGTVIKGADYEAGAIVDTDQETGVLLVGMKKAIEVKPEAKSEPLTKQKKRFTR